MRVVSSDQLPGGEAPPISFAQDYDQIDGNNGGEPVAPAPTRPAELSYREAISRILAQSQFGNVDLLIIDLATGLDRLYSLASMVALDGVLLLSHPSTQDTSAARHAMKIGRAIGAPIVGIVENMVGFNCDGCRAVRPLWPEGDLHGIAREAAVPILARLAFEPRLADSTDRGVLFVREYASTPTGKVLADIANQVDAMVAARTRAVERPPLVSIAVGIFVLVGRGQHRVCHARIFKHPGAAMSAAAKASRSRATCRCATARVRAATAE